MRCTMLLFFWGCVEEFPSLPNKQVIDKLDEDYDGDGFSEIDGDCDDDNVLLSPSTMEICDGIDNNCDGVIDVAPFSLHSNGVTVVCGAASVGDTGVVNGITYTKRNRAELDSLKQAQNWSEFATTCTSGITTFNSLFFYAAQFNEDISSWDTSSVTDMNYMFREAHTFNQDISAWDVSNVIDMSYAFSRAYDFNQDIGSWDVSSVYTIRYMFNNADSFNQDISGWDVSNVSNGNAMEHMFSFNDTFNQDLSGWCVSNISSEPSGFDTAANAWTLPRPVWGTCP